MRRLVVEKKKAVVTGVTPLHGTALQTRIEKR
jgi:hypothetical protein